MDYFARLRAGAGSSNASANAGINEQPAAAGASSVASSSQNRSRSPAGVSKGKASPPDTLNSFMRNWEMIRVALENPDQRALHHGIARTDVPARIAALTDAIVFEHNRVDEGTAGPCMDYVVRHDVFGTLVGLAERDEPRGIKTETIRAFANLVILLDARFLSSRVVHRAIYRLIQSCVAEDDRPLTEEQWLLMGEEQAQAHMAKRAGLQGQPWEDDLVDLMCHICSRIRSSPELLPVFMKAKKVKRKRAATLSPQPPRPPSPARSDSSTSTLRAGQSGRSSAQTRSPQLDAGTFTPPREDKREYRYSFPIFNHLLRFVHREGKAGEVARAGTLFCFDLALGKSAFQQRAEGSVETLAAPEDDDRSAASAESDKQRLPTRQALLTLARIIADSDFPEVFGASLGAVYGLLPGKLIVPTTSASSQEGAAEHAPTGMSIGSGPQAEAERKQREEVLADRGVVSSEDELVRSTIKLLASLLQFAQDVLSAALDEAPSHAVQRASTPALAQHAQELSELGEMIAASMASFIRHSLLRSILYPAMLECSDADGSATAVLSYLEALLLCIDDASPLANIVIGFLCADDAGAASPGGQQLKKRKSSALLRLQSSKAHAAATEYFSDAHVRYTLKDIIYGHISADTAPDARAAALRLASTLVQRHGRFAIRHLSAPVYDASATPFPSFDKRPDGVLTFSLKQHYVEMQLFSSLVSTIAGPSASGDSVFGFERALHDAEDALGRDSLFSLGMQICSPDQSATREVLSPMLDQLRHRINPSDRFYRSLVSSLASFFVQPPEINIALTGLLSALCLCPVRSLEGWLTWPARDRQLSKDNAPVLPRVLQSLAQQVAQMRPQIDDLDTMLAERRSGLVFLNNLQDALHLEQHDDVREADAAAEKELLVEQEAVAAAAEALTPDSADRIGPVRRLEAPQSALPVKPSEEPFPMKKRREGFARWFGGGRTKPSRPSTAGAAEAKSLSGVQVAVPFAMHYSLTDNIEIELPRTVAIPSAWSESSDEKRLRFGGDSSLDDISIDSAASASSYVYPGEDDANAMVKVCLSSVLDNVVILEEAVKELAAIVQTRRNVGIDLLELSLA